MACLEKEDLSRGIVHLAPKIDLIGCDYDMRNYTEFLDKKFKSLKDKTSILKTF